MVDRSSGEQGTTLVELLVVIALLAVVGTITTAGIVTGFRAQSDATNVAETLDGMRIATQRVREYVRAADEVCATSSATELRVWSDENRNGFVDPGEIDIFEVVTIGADTVFQRRSPTPSGTEVTQLIRDDIINGTVFVYDQPVADQPADNQCDEGTGDGSGTAAVRVVDVIFQVDHPDPAEADLLTSTSVRLRNAELAEPSANVAPDADIVIACPTDNQECELDGSGSSDPEDGDATTLFFTWEIFDGATLIDTVTGYGFDGSAILTYAFLSGDRDYGVTLTVTDSDGATNTTTAVASPVAPGTNAPPVAAFTVECSALQCDFDASDSSDDDGIDSYDWTFGDGSVGSGITTSHPFVSDGSFTVTLTVEDSDEAVSSFSRVVTVGSNVFYVSAMSGVQTGSGSNRVASVSVQLSLTTAGPPDPGIVITVEATDKTGSTDTLSCTSDTLGQCKVSFTGLRNSQFPITARVLSITSTGLFTYDSSQDAVDEVTIS